MAHHRKAKPSPRLPLTGYCTECAKVRYMSRKDANQAATRLGKRMRAYRCPGNATFWHLASWQPQGRVLYYRNQAAREE